MSILISAGIIFVILLLVVVLAFCIPMPVEKTMPPKSVVSELRFTEQSRQQYVNRMTDAQPVFNDRLLQGEGKNHMFDAIAKVASNRVTVAHSVLDQVGDTFS